MNRWTGLATEFDAASCCSAPAYKYVIVIGGGPIVREFLAWDNLPERNKCNLPLHAIIRIARVLTRAVEVHHLAEAASTPAS